MQKGQTKSSTIKKKEGPVKNKSSYMFFCSDERKTINDEKLGLNNKEILVELGVRWKVLKEENSERYQTYVKIAEQDKERYIKEKGVESKKVDLDDSNEEDTDSNKVKKTKNVKKDENNEDDKKPKTKINGYINFCKLKRAEFKKKYSNLQPKDITRELGAAWKVLNDSEKEEYKAIISA